MFHVISGWLTRHARQIRDYRLDIDQAFATAHGWQAEQVAPGVWMYRDPRFVQLMAAHTGQPPASQPQRAGG